MLMQEARGEQALRRLDPELRAQITPELEAALRREMGAPQWQRHPFDLRFSLPWFGQRYYLAFVAGPERRSAARRRVDRQNRRGNRMLLTAAGATLALSSTFLALLAFGLLTP